MPTRNFVREIKPENIKDINPSDIIYLALKDGSIVLVADNDDDTFDYEDIKFDSTDNTKIRSSSNYSNIKFYKNKKQKKTISTHETTDNENNLKTNKYSSLLTNKNKFSSFSTDMNQNKPIIMSHRNEKISNYTRYKNAKDNLNQTYNYSKNNYISEFSKTTRNMNNYIKKEKLEKSFDNINNIDKVENNFFHKIEYNNKDNVSVRSYKTDNSIYQRPKSSRSQKQSYNNIKEKIKNNSYSVNRTPIKKESKEKLYNKKNYNNTSLINISNLSINDESNIMNRTQEIEKRDIYREYFDNNEKAENNYRKVNVFKNGEHTRNLSYNKNAQTPNTYYVKRKEMEIMGRIVNDDDSFRLNDHKHPQTLFDEKCPYCQSLARKNKLCLSNIKEESIYDNHSFVASFGGSSSKRGKTQNKISSNYYKML